MTSKNHKGVLVAFVSVFLTIAFLTLPLNIRINEAKAQETPRAKIQIAPSELTVGQLGVSLPTPLTTVDVMVSNVTNLYAWQVTVVYNEEVLQFENVTGSTFPPNNIFGNFSIFEKFLLPAVVKVDLVTHKSILKVGGTLFADIVGVNGSGLLAQLNFRGVSTGTTDLTFEVGDPNDPDTYLLNSTKSGINLLRIPTDLAGAKVTVLGNGLSMAFSSKEFTVGQSTNITGSLFPQEIADIVISYRTYSENTTPGEWQTITTMQTQRVDINETYWEARYSYTWKPEKQGTYQLKAEGGGYTSQLIKVIVNQGIYVRQLGIEFYGPITGIVAFGAVGFFVWDRRRRRSGRLILP